MNEEEKKIIEETNWIWREHLRMMIESMNKQWHWLCENHPMVAREYQDHRREQE